MYTVFKERRDIAATWAWLLVLMLLPILGFVIYLFVGKKVSKEKIFDLKAQEHLGVMHLVRYQKKLWKERELLPGNLLTDEARQITHLFLDADKSIVTKHNEVDVFTNGCEKFKSLLNDIKKATSHIHLEYYAFLSDQIGKKILNELVKAQKRGVKVRLIYDSLGSRGQKHNFFKDLRKNGGEIATFLEYRKFRSKSPRLNYRDHRKIAVIDGKIGYIGGFNIGDEYLGLSKRFGNWRDTHLRIIGAGVAALQARFLMDWNATIKHDKNREQVAYSEKYFPIVVGKGNVDMQVVSSGPDSNLETIKLGYLKMITRANKYVYVQTPYLIPDDSIYEALCVASLSGIKVRVMIPNKPDHPFVYRATQYYARQLIKSGVELYQYDNGFLHSKTIVIDDQIASVGSANMDFRSFRLNFETNAFCYDRKLATQLRKNFEKDLKNCTRLSEIIYKRQSRWVRFKQQFSRLLSPIL